MASNIEIEIKLQVPDAARARVAQAVATATAQRTRLQAAYFDTPDRRLAAAGIALRLRNEGGQWVQTLKAGAAHALQRLEHNAPVAGPDRPVLDLGRHAGTPAADALAAALRPAPGEAAPALVEQYRTDILRTHRVVRGAGGAVELAFDVGEIAAGEHVWPVCELEIEGVHGGPRVVLAQARRWVQRHGLWLDVRSKAERGARLARFRPSEGAASPFLGAPIKAAPLTLAAPDAPAAARAIAAACLGQILRNASEIASGTHGDEHVHQLRVGLRRLRAGLRLSRGWAPPLADEAVDTLADLFRQLGAARDRTVLLQTLAPALQEAEAPPIDLPAPAAVDVTAAVRAQPVTLALIDLQAWALLEPEGSDDGAPWLAPTAPLRDLLRARLHRWHRRCRRAAKGFATLPDLDRHMLRKDLKQLRYALEFSQAPLAGAGGRKRLARYLDALARAQVSLGDYCDVSTALAMCREQTAHDARAWFAVGWLTARREALVAECVEALGAFRRATQPWA
jgi:triphosphatase